MPLADYQQLVDDLVRDRENVVSADQRDAALAAALARYSADQPREVVVDVVSSGGQLLDLPDGFTEDSALLSLEYPVGQVPASEIPRAEISLYRTPEGRRIALPLALDAGASVRVSYTAAQLLDADQDTIPARHRQAVASLAAAIVCGQLASWYASESDPAISADTVNHQSKSQQWRLRAKDLAAVYDAVVGPAQSGRTQPASATVQLEPRNAHGRRYLFHPPRQVRP